MANVEHSVLTGSDLHESKGVAAAANNRVFVTNGAGSGSFQQVPAAAIAAAGVLVFQAQLYHIRDERSSGTDSDTLTVSTWNTRALNTEVTDELTVTTSGNQMSLAAGTYYIEVNASTYFQGTYVHNTTTNQIFSKLRLRNVTDSTTLINGQSWTFMHADDGGGNDCACSITAPASLSGRFTLAGTKSIEVQNWVVNNMGAGVLAKVTKSGKAISSGENEVYTDVRLWKIA
jgi:hypothetical protein